MHARFLFHLEADMPMTGWLRFCVGLAIVALAVTPLVYVLTHH